jgi:hypothetical protein
MSFCLESTNRVMPKTAGGVQVLSLSAKWAYEVRINSMAESRVLSSRTTSVRGGLLHSCRTHYKDIPTAARIAQKQTGVVTSLDKLTADHLSTLLNEVLSNATYRDNALKLQKAIAEANELSVATDLVEESLGGGKKGRQSVR